MPKRMTELEAELGALRDLIEELVGREPGAELCYRWPDGEIAELPADLRARLRAALGSTAGRDLSRQLKRLEEVARASRRALFHMRREHHRLSTGCEYCAFELGQLERALTRLHVPGT